MIMGSSIIIIHMKNIETIMKLKKNTSMYINETITMKTTIKNV